MSSVQAGWRARALPPQAVSFCPACASTAGDGDVHIAFLPCQLVVESMRRGMSPKAAAEHAVRRIARRVPSYVGAVVAVSKDGAGLGLQCGGRPWATLEQQSCTRVPAPCRADPAALALRLRMPRAGQHGGAAHGWDFRYSVASAGSGGEVQVFEVPGLPAEEEPADRAPEQPGSGATAHDTT